MSYQTHSALQKPGLAGVASSLFKHLAGPVVMHALMLLLLWWFATPWLYALWWVAYLTTFMLFSRIRNAAEHANVPDLLDADPRLHARTVYARWWEKLTVAPNDVNFHLEHHWHPAVPPYRLAAFHAFLKTQGLLEDVEIMHGYTALLKKLVTPRQNQAA